MNFTDKQLMEAAELFPSLWVAQHKLKNEKGLPLEFKERKFLLDIYNDLSPLQVLLKPPQIGATVMQTLKSFYIAKKLNKQIIYTLPTQGDVIDMVGGAINRIIAQNPILMEWVKDHDTVEQKQVGTSMIFYRGTFSQKQAMMIPSDLNIHDEVDASDQSVVVHYENRLMANANGMRWYFSHPSLLGHGVDIYWQQSDKKEWFIKCPHCLGEQILTWPDNIDIENKLYICSLCKGLLPDESRSRGEWKKTAEGEFSGYHVSQLMCSWISAARIVDAFKDPMKDKQYFYNYVLGLPYADSDDKIEPATVLLNTSTEVNEQKPVVYIGVDPGLPIHYVLMNKDGVFNYNTCENWKHLEELLKRFPRSVIVSDQGGDLTPQRELMERYPGRVFICYYRPDRKSKEIITWGENAEYGKVSVDRNRMITLMVGQLRDIGRIRLNGTKEEWTDFASHFGNMYRERIVVKEAKDKDDSSLYGDKYVWKRSGPDHFVHSLLYAMVGMTRGTGQMAQSTGGSDFFQGMAKGVIVQEGGIPAEAFRETLW